MIKSEYVFRLEKEVPIISHVPTHSDSIERKIDKE